jgi:hypothetical protein
VTEPALVNPTVFPFRSVMSDTSESFGATQLIVPALFVAPPMMVNGAPA